MQTRVNNPIFSGAHPTEVKNDLLPLVDFQKKGIQFGQLIEYSLPHLTPYKQFANGYEFPNSWSCSQHVINLPVYSSLKERDRIRIVEAIKSYKITR